MDVIQMLVDDIGDVTVTNDGATILKLLEVQHPAAKVRLAGDACGLHAAAVDCLQIISMLSSVKGCM
jgi:hypothetical protein